MVWRSVVRCWTRRRKPRQRENVSSLSRGLARRFTWRSSLCRAWTPAPAANRSSKPRQQQAAHAAIGSDAPQVLPPILVSRSARRATSATPTCSHRPPARGCTHAALEWHNRKMAGDRGRRDLARLRVRSAWLSPDDETPWRPSTRWIAGRSSTGLDRP